MKLDCCTRATLRSSLILLYFVNFVRNWVTTIGVKTRRVGFHPTGTPHDIVMKLHAAATRAIQAPDIRDRMSAEGAEFVGDTPEQFAAYIRAESEKWARVVKQGNIKTD